MVRCPHCKKEIKQSEIIKKIIQITQYEDGYEVKDTLSSKKGEFHGIMQLNSFHDLRDFLREIFHEGE